MFVCQQDYAKTNEQITTKLGETYGMGKNRTHYGLGGGSRFISTFFYVLKSFH